MEKLSENYKMGCSVYNMLYRQVCECQIAQEPYTYAPYTRCDIGKIVNRLREYEEFDMTPEEIKTVLGEYKDQLKVALNTNQEILNENTENFNRASKLKSENEDLKEENLELKKVIRNLQADKAALMMKNNKISGLEDENERLKICNDALSKQLENLLGSYNGLKEELDAYEHTGFTPCRIGELMRQDKVNSAENLRMKATIEVLEDGLEKMKKKQEQTEKELNEYKEIGLDARAISGLIKGQYDEISEYQTWLHRYHELGLTPDEIRQILQDGEEIADACIEYKNKLIDMQDAWEVARKKAYGYDTILDYGRFSVDDIEEWRRKAEKYDKMNILEADIEPAVGCVSACDVCVYKSTSYLEELKRKAKLYDDLVVFLSDRIFKSHVEQIK